jgi:hypothetical protein
MLARFCAHHIRRVLLLRIDKICPRLHHRSSLMPGAETMTGHARVISQPVPRTRCFGPAGKCFATASPRGAASALRPPARGVPWRDLFGQVGMGVGGESGRHILDLSL